MSEPLIDIRPDNWAIVADILRRHVPDREIWAFGSRAKWNAKEYSDLDLAVIGETPLSLSVSAALADDFSESDLPFKVDVVDWETTSESFRTIIERDKVVVQRAAKGLDMAGDWIETTIGEQVTLQRGIDITRADQRAGIVPVVSSGGVSSYHDTPAASGPGVILGRKGVVGSVYYVPSDYWPHDTTLWVKDFHGNDQRFVYYFFRWLAPRIATMDVGSANPTLNRNHVHPIEIRWPTRVAEQRAIAHILGTLDDKIELNRRMNETLEAMARALFKSWFVDFDPVRAKQPKNVGWVSPSGRNPPDKTDGGLRGYAANPPYELPPHIADLFPARLADSELGEIPEGWTVKTLGEVTEYLNRGISPAYVEAGGVLVLNQKCVRGGHVDLSKGRRHDPAKRSIDGRPLRVGDVLVNSTGVGTLGRVAQLLTIDEETIVDSHVTVVRADESSLSWNFLGIYLLRRVDEIEALGEGSTGQTELARSRLVRLSVIVPKRDVVVSFDRIALPLREKAAVNNRESRTLAALRDTLLPRLISGELRAKDAERFVGVCL